WEASCAAGSGSGGWGRRASPPGPTCTTRSAAEDDPWTRRGSSPPGAWRETSPEARAGPRRDSGSRDCWPAPPRSPGAPSRLRAAAADRPPVGGTARGMRLPAPRPVSSFGAFVAPHRSRRPYYMPESTGSHPSQALALFGVLAGPRLGEEYQVLSPVVSI